MRASNQSSSCEETTETFPAAQHQVRKLGIIGGSSFLHSKYFEKFENLTISTAHGPVYVKTNAQRTVYFVQRHGADPAHEYCPPHSIPKKAIAAALHNVGCSHVIGFGSVGSLKKTLPVSTLVVPHDYMNPWSPITYYDHDKRGHFVPGFAADLRKDIITVSNVHCVI